MSGAWRDYGATNDEKKALLENRDVEEGSYTQSNGELVNSTDSTISKESVLTFHDISYILPQRNWRCKRTRDKVILNNVSGIMSKGLNAILGPTGSGKTSLLDILADRKSNRYVSGIVLLNGQMLPKNYKCASGYVVQDDVVMGTLTVRENLSFSAALRLPSHYSSAERRRRVNNVIEELGLRDCADTKIGNEFLRGVSGGEKKRTNIGMELIISPKVLYLDEPTTGLDASTATSVIQLLKKLSSRGRTIILSIHQPRYSIFKQFDSMTLLSKGNMVYHGSAKKALEYFTHRGFVCEEHDNPADFFLDVIMKNEELLMVQQTSSAVSMNQPQVISPEENPLAVHYKTSEEFQTAQKQLNPIKEQYLTNIRTNRVSREKAAVYRTTFFWQLLMVSWRSWINVLRNPMTSVLQIFITLLFGAVVGLIYLQLSQNIDGFRDRWYIIQLSERLKMQFGLINLLIEHFDPEGLHQRLTLRVETFDQKIYEAKLRFQMLKESKDVPSKRIGAFFFIIMNQVFGNLSAIELFIRQRAIFIHENASGFYRVSSYFLAKVLCDLIPLRIIPIVIFSVITYFMIGFQLEADKFFIYTLTLILTSSVATSIGFAISALVRVAGLANLLIALCFVVAMVFGGFLISFNSLGVWLSWLQYISLFKYALAALSVNELEGVCFCDSFNSSLFPAYNNTPCELLGDPNVRPPPCINGTAYLDDQKFLTFPSLWYNELALFIMVVIVLLLAYVNLRLIKKEK